MSVGAKVQLCGVCKSFPGPSGETVVLDGIELTIEPGQSLAITGPSGSGKSTLLNLLGALDRPSGGQVLIDGQNPAQLSEREAARLRNIKIGFVFQLHHLLVQCTALENVLAPTLAEKRSHQQRRLDIERAESLLQRVGLAERMNYFPGQLSAGQRQRVALVRALINEPGLLLADEPTGSLDQPTAEQAAELLTELHRDYGFTLIAATHWSGLAERIGKQARLFAGKLR